MSPYRARRDKPRERPEPKPGMITDMVRQFADPYAFLRELVQNSLDAGTTRIEVSVVRSSDGEVTTSVSDDGSGMTPAIMENALLTLFSSSKEGDPSKIGKYGVGFISVLAIDPDAVQVDTWREGGAWRARIARDHSWTIEELEPRSRSGTTVTLEGQMDADAFDRHASLARASLLRWCRHASVPIHFSCTDYSQPGQAKRERLDAPLSLDAVATASDASDGDVVLVGPAAGADRLPGSPDRPPASFVGFYNRGLTLYETESEPFPGLEGMLVKISSPDLKHTLSRDNVRREGRFSELLAKARSLAKEAVPAAVENALREQAQHVARGGDAAHYLALIVASGSPQVSLGPKTTWFPLTDAIDGEVAMSAHELVKRTPRRAPVLTATEPDVLTRAFAASGRPVVLCTSADVVLRLAAVQGDRAPRSCEPAQEGHALVEELPSTDTADSDAALCRELARLLGAAGSPIAGAALARAFGMRPSTAVLAHERIRGVVSSDQAHEAATQWGEKSTLLLDVREQAVLVARQRARSQLRAAAHLLARALLLDRDGAVSRGVNRDLLEDFAREAT